MTRQGIAQLAGQGRGGDSTLVHMRPDEVAAMQRMAQQRGRSMTINPRTGLPEAWGIKDLFNINTYTKPIQKAAEQIGLGGVSNAISGAAKTLGQNAQYILPFIPGAAFAGLGGLGNFLSSPLGRGVLAGGIGALQGGRPNLKRGLFSGLTAYGLSGAYQGLQAAGNVAAAPGSSDPFGGFEEAAGSAIERAGGVPPPRGMSEEELLRRTGEWAGTIPASAEPVAQAAKAPGLMSELSAAGRGISNIALGDQATAEAAKKAFTGQFGKGAMAATYMGASGLAALDEQEKYIREQLAQQKISQAEFAQRKARIDAARQRAEAAMRANPYQLSYAIGGEISEDYKLTTPQLGGAPDDQKNIFGLAQGGMPTIKKEDIKRFDEDSRPDIGSAQGMQMGYAPMYAQGGMAARYIDGPGDGMSDSVRARIGGIQEARLADGEFVIPSDVVSHLGNGSSKAGANQLYEMMDRVRKARTGTKKQGKEIKPTKLMPA